MDFFTGYQYYVLQHKDLFGKSHIVIVESIKNELMDCAEYGPIERFLKLI